MKDSTKYLIAVIVFSVSIIVSTIIYSYQEGVKVYKDGYKIVVYNTWTGERTYIIVDRDYSNTYKVP